MKKVIVALFGIVMVASNLLALEASPADKKWCEAVEKKIATGPAEVSTPSETRVQLLKAKAAEMGRQCEVTKTSTGFRVAVR
jgi:hypothetical protein